MVTSSFTPPDNYTKPFHVNASYDDKNIFKVKVTNIPVFVQSTVNPPNPLCPDVGQSGIHATFTGNYQFSSNVTDLS